MKKLILYAAILVCGVASADPILFWGSDTAFGAGSGVVYTNGVSVAQGSNWLVELINTADESVLYSTTSGFAAGDGVFFDTPDATSWNGLTVKTVIYDASTKETAGLFAQFTATANLSWSTVPTAPATFDYNAGSVSSALGTGAGQWQAIPEPTVAALIGIFGGGMVAGRRLFLKS
jgi:hypothetical protein